MSNSEFDRAEIVHQRGVLASEIGQKLGVNFLAGPLISTEHKSVAVVEVEKVEAIRDLILQSGLIQWNSIDVLPSITMEQAIQEVEKPKPIC